MTLLRILGLREERLTWYLCPGSTFSLKPKKYILELKRLKQNEDKKLYKTKSEKKFIDFSRTVKFQGVKKDEAVISFPQCC